MRSTAPTAIPGAPDAASAGPEAHLRRAGERLARREAELKAEIEAEHRSTRDWRSTRTKDVIDVKEDAAGEVQRSVEQAEIERDVGELAEIQLALRRVAAGTYGLCSDCGDPIDEQRLDAQPSAVRCAGCQSAHERHTRAAGRRA